MKLKRFAPLLALVALLVFASVVFACATWITSVPTCEGVTVSALPPDKYPGDSSYKYSQIVSGTGTFAWNGSSSYTPTVVVEYKKKQGQTWLYKYLSDYGATVHKPANCYVPCSSTVTVTHEWSLWTLVDNLFQRTQIVDEVDSRDATHVCSTQTNVETDTVCVWDPTIRTGDAQCYDHYQVCDVTTTVTHDWSLWTLVDNLFQRTQIVDEVDSRDATHVCSTQTNVETDTVCVWDPTIRTGDAQCYDHYEVCSVTNTVYGEWSDWMPVDGNPLQEYRTRTVTIVDSRDATVSCGNSSVEIDTRPVGFCTAYPNDPSCVPCSVAGKEDLMSNDPNCKVPEKKPYIPPTVVLECTSDACLGNSGHSVWTDFVHPGSNEMIFFATATSGCYEVHGWNPGSDWVMPFRTVQLVPPEWIGELIGGQPFSAVLDGNIVQATKGTDGYWRLPVKFGQNPILLDGLAPEGPYSASMLEDGTLVRWSGSFMGFDSQLGFLP